MVFSRFLDIRNIDDLGKKFDFRKLRQVSEHDGNVIVALDGKFSWDAAVPSERYYAARKAVSKRPMRVKDVRLSYPAEKRPAKRRRSARGGTNVIDIETFGQDYEKALKSFELCINGRPNQKYFVCSIWDTGSERMNPKTRVMVPYDLDYCFGGSAINHMASARYVVSEYRKLQTGAART